MSEEERKKQDNEGARLHWTRLMAQAYDAACPPVLFSKTLNSARERIDERDSNQRTALMIAVMGGSPDDEAALARQQEKAVLLVQCTCALEWGLSAFPAASRWLHALLYFDSPNALKFTSVHGRRYIRIRILQTPQLPRSDATHGTAGPKTVPRTYVVRFETVLR